MLKKVLKLTIWDDQGREKKWPDQKYIDVNQNAVCIFKL